MTTRTRTRHVLPLDAPSAGHRALERCPVCVPVACQDMAEPTGPIVWVHRKPEVLRPDTGLVEPLIAWDGER